MSSRKKDSKSRVKSSATMSTTAHTPHTQTNTQVTAPTTGTTSTTSTSSLGLGALVQHKLLHKNSAVIKFCGNVGSIPADIEGFIESVENHLASLSLGSEEEKLTEAKLYFDYSPKGDLKINCQSSEFRRIKRWPDMKVYLRTIYGQVDRKDPPVSLSKILRDLEKSEGYYKTYMANTFLKLNEFSEILANSDWVTPDRTAIKLEELGNLLYLALGLKYLPEAITNSIRDTWQPVDNFSIFSRRIEEAFRNNPQIDRSKLVNQVESPSESNASNSATVNLIQKKTQPRNTQSPKPREKRDFVCYKCRKSGHLASECRNVRKPYCSYHKTNTHNTFDCRDRHKFSNPRNSKVGLYKQPNFQPNRSSNTYRQTPRNPSQQNPPYPTYTQQPVTYQPPGQVSHPNLYHEQTQYSPYQHTRIPPTQTVNQIGQNPESSREVINPTPNFPSSPHTERPV